MSIALKFVKISIVSIDCSIIEQLKWEILVINVREGKY